MPSWRTHWSIARLLGYQPDPRVEELIDSKPLHDLGISIVRQPLPGGASEKRLKASRLAKEALEYLARRADLFYLHHVLDGIVERLASSMIIGEPLRPERVLAAEEHDTWDIRLRILSAKIVDDFPGPSKTLFERLAAKWNEVIERLTDDAKRMHEGRLREEKETLDAIIKRCVDSAIEKAKPYYQSLLGTWHPEKAQSMTRNYALGVCAYCLALKAAERSRLIDYLLVYGAPRRKVYTELLKLIEDASLLPLLFPPTAKPSDDELEKLKEAYEAFRNLIEEMLHEAEKLATYKLKALYES